MERIFANILVLSSIMFLPWWLVVFLLLVLLFIFDFIEIIAYGFILDIMYSLPSGFFSKNLFLISAVVAYFIFTIVRPNLRGS